jgi:DNA helicase IV
VERVKGLEFDSVVVVEPAAHSPGQLYVALTRTTRRLVLVHSRPLPAALDGARP